MPIEGSLVLFVAEAAAGGVKEEWREPVAQHACVAGLPA